MFQVHVTAQTKKAGKMKLSSRIILLDVRIHVCTNILPLHNFPVEYGSWAQCILDWEKFRDDNPDYPLYLTSYELMHRVISVFFN